MLLFGIGATQTNSPLRALSAVAAASVAILQGVGFLSPPPCSASTGYIPSDSAAGLSARLGPCEANSNCVSSYYLEPPNRYISPFKTLKTDRDASFQRAVRDLSALSSSRDGRGGRDIGQIGLIEVVPKDRYAHLTVPGTSPGSLDDLELLYSSSLSNGDDGSIVHVRCEARVTLPIPPFCLQKNCINGNMDQRMRVERIGRDVLGLPPADRERMEKGSKWTPIFFNSDRVPGFDDDI